MFESQDNHNRSANRGALGVAVHLLAAAKPIWFSRANAPAEFPAGIRYYWECNGKGDCGAWVRAICCGILTLWLDDILNPQGPRGAMTAAKAAIQHGLARGALVEMIIKDRSYVGRYYVHLHPAAAVKHRAGCGVRKHRAHQALVEAGTTGSKTESASAIVRTEMGGGNLPLPLNCHED